MMWPAALIDSAAGLLVVALVALNLVYRGPQGLEDAHSHYCRAVLCMYISKSETMAEDPFEKARKEMERAQRDFHRHMERAQKELHGAMEAGQRLIAGALAEFAEKMERFRSRMQQTGPRADGWSATGIRKPPRGRSGRDRKPRDPHPRGPQPAPVRPTNPSFLSGGAEAPLDE